MNGIPADVTEAAKGAYIEASRAKKKPLDPFDIVAAVERAILAERARCAGLVEAENARVLAVQTGKPEDFEIDHRVRMLTVLLPDLAAAIRKGDHT